MRINGILPCSFVNGYGSRFVVFVQGCERRCPGCHNPETWDPSGGFEVSAREIADVYKKHKLLDGITLSGGEPFNQQDACMELLDLLPDVNTWIYTGFEYEEICDTPLAKRADVIVAGKFVQELMCEGKMYGSLNQKIVRVKKYG